MTLTRVDFNPQLFEDLILQKGLRIKWEKAVNCPCIDAATTRPVEGCVNCDSRGKLYFGASEIKGLITRQNKELEIGDTLGVLEPGEGYLTTSSVNRLTIWDRVTNLDSVAIYHEVLIHDETGGDWLRYPPVGLVDFAVHQPSRTSPQVILQQNTDFTVDADGKIQWLSANKPKANQGISFRYVHNPVWLVINTPNYVRDTFVIQDKTVDTPTALPLRVQIRLEHLGMAPAVS
jgi:hypothetical protein